MDYHGEMKLGEELGSDNPKSEWMSWGILKKLKLLFSTRHNVERETWLKEYGLVKAEDLHPDFRELYLRVGYRPIPSSYSSCLKSIFYPTNETLNFWTHFLSLIILLHRFFTIFDGLQGSAFEMIYAPIVIYGFGVCIMLVGSCFAHVFCCASHKVRESCWFCDYASITLSSLGSAVIYNNYVCPYDCVGISIPRVMPFLGIAGVFGHAACCYSRRMTSKWRYLLRSSVFVVLYIGSSVPCVIKYFTVAFSGVSSNNLSQLNGDVRCSLDTEPQRNALYFLLVTTFCALTVFFNVSKVPEKWLPGTFDIVGHSHQWLHVCIAVAFYFQTFIVEDVIKKVEILTQNGYLQSLRGSSEDTSSPVKVIPQKPPLYPNSLTDLCFKALVSVMQYSPDVKELGAKAKSTCNGMNETIHMVANDPSLGMYRIQQHVKKSMPKVVSADSEIKECNAHLKGLVYDASYADEAIRSITSSMGNFSRIEKLLREATSNAAVIKMKRSSSHIL